MSVLPWSGSHSSVFKPIFQVTALFLKLLPTVAILSAEEALWGICTDFLSRRVGGWHLGVGGGGRWLWEAAEVEKGHRKQIRCLLMPRRRLNETGEFDPPRVIRTVESPSSSSADGGTESPRGSLKVHFFKKYLTSHHAAPSESYLLDHIFLLHML